MKKKIIYWIIVGIGLLPFALVLIGIIINHLNLKP